jgi:hypothetical protein
MGRTERVVVGRLGRPQTGRATLARSGRTRTLSDVTRSSRQRPGVPNAVVSQVGGAVRVSRGAQHGLQRRQPHRRRGATLEPGGHLGHYGAGGTDHELRCDRTRTSSSAPLVLTAGPPEGGTVGSMEQPSKPRRLHPRLSRVSVPAWWTAPWGSDLDRDPDTGWGSVPGETPEAPASTAAGSHSPLPDDEMILATLEAQFGQVRSKSRVRDLAEVFTHQREVDAMLDQIPEAFAALDMKFLEPACGSGNFLTEILRRKLRPISTSSSVCQEQYEHRLLRAAASIYGIDISPSNVVEARGRMAHVLLEHYQTDANTIAPTAGFLNAAALVLGANIAVGDTLTAADAVELCDWQPHPAGRFQRVWSYALVPEDDRNLFWAERVQDAIPAHYAELTSNAPAAQPSGKSARTPAIKKSRSSR